MNAVLRVEDTYGAIRTFEIALQPNPESIFQYSIGTIGMERIHPQGSGTIGTDRLLQESHVSPDHVTEHPFDDTFELEGAFYRMPFPATELERNGWQLYEQGNLGIGERRKVHVRKGESELTIRI